MGDIQLFKEPGRRVRIVRTGTKEWACAVCNRTYSEPAAEQASHTCVYCQQPLFDEDGRQFSRFEGEAAEKILPKEH